METKVNPLASVLGLVDTVIVITVEGENKRQEQVKQLLDSHEVPFHYLYGADFRKSSIDELKAEQIYDPSLKLRDQQPLLTPGEVGCAVSHRMAAEKVAAGEYGSVLVLEDDVLILEQNLATLEASISSMPSDWDLLYLGYNKQNLSMPWSIRLKLLSWYPLRYWLGSKRHDPSSIRRIYRGPYDRYWYRAGCFNGAHAYAINTTAAEYLVKLQTPVRLEADVALKHLVRFSGLNSYCLRDDVFDQRRDVPSLVGDRPAWHHT
ncbi:glycosyltransferase family 25 protein [Pseudomonadota bacterium]